MLLQMDVYNFFCSLSPCILNKIRKKAVGLHASFLGSLSSFGSAIFGSQ